MATLDGGTAFLDAVSPDPTSSGAMSDDPSHTICQLPAADRHELSNAGTYAVLNHRRACLEYHERTLATPRYQEEGRLLVHGYRTLSQNDEDGIIQEIFRRIGAGRRRFFEIGVEGGFECNTAALLPAGWTGTWVEAELGHKPSVDFKLSHWLKDERLRVHWQKVTPDNIDSLMAREPHEPDLLSIDIDGHDYWVWQALTVARPRVVIIEYNATLRPPLSVVVPYRADQVWDGTNYFGASLGALTKLGATKGYSLVGCCFSGVNAFFVRDDLVGDLFRRPFSAENHYEPARYFMQYPFGHPPNLGAYIEV